MKYLTLVLIFFIVGCGNKPLIVDNKIYNCYGFMDRDDEKKNNVVYEISAENMIGTFLLSETVFIPIWNLGWNTYCPVKALK